MITEKKLTNGKISRVTTGIDLKIINYINNKDKLDNEDLSIINLYFYDNSFLLTHINYLVLKLTQNKFNLISNYEIRGEKENLEEEKIIKLLNEITEIIDEKEVINYEYFENIKDVWMKFAIPFSYLYLILFL